MRNKKSNDLNSLFVGVRRALSQFGSRIGRRRLLVIFRRRWWLLPLLITAGFSFFVSAVLFGGEPREEGGLRFGSSLIFGFTALNILLICALAFLVGRNVVRLVFDRRRKTMGSALRLRLVLAFVGLTAIPTTFLFIVSKGLLSQAMSDWFKSQVESSLESAVVIARHHLSEMKVRLSRQSERLQAEIRGNTFTSPKSLETFLEARREELGLFSVRVFGERLQQEIYVANVNASLEGFAEPPVGRDALERALRGEVFVLKEEEGASIYLRAYNSLRNAPPSKVVVLSYRLDPELTQSISIVNDTYQGYEQLRLFKGPLRSWYLLSLSLVTGAILFGAIWVGFYIARQITVPIQKLAEATGEVARGNYDTHIRAASDDEIGVLVKSFNAMTSDLKSSRFEIDRRQRYIETILAHLAVGVLGVDAEGKITSINEAARDILSLHGKDFLQQDLASVEDSDELRQLRPLLSELSAADGALERETVIVSEGREVRLLCTVGHMQSAEGESLGTVYLFDDLTDLVKAQQLSAWREVARRIAHEIKNPLTPIQLSAQRIERLFSQSEHAETVSDSVQAIVENVDSIKRLANEFSQFARMPTAEFKVTDLNALVADTIAPYAENNPQVSIRFIASPKVPHVHLDAEQIRRVVINLVDNSIAAFLDKGKETDAPEIRLKTSFDEKRKRVVLEVLDNGPGVPAAYRSKVFDPYFTTKREGSGLGLAIVSAILAEHHGTVRLYENLPRGARFVVELPLIPRVGTQRKFASV